MDNWISRRWVCPYFYLLSIIRKLIHWNVWWIKKLKKRISIQNNDNKCFLWCYIRHLNQLKIHLERITKADRRMVNNLDYVDIKFPVSKKDYWGRFRGGTRDACPHPLFLEITCFLPFTLKNYKLCLLKLNWSLIMHFWHTFAQILSKHI